MTLSSPDKDSQVALPKASLSTISAVMQGFAFVASSTGVPMGHGCLRLGQSYLDRLDLRSVANAELRVLMRATESTCHLVVLSGHDVIYLDKV